MKLLPIALAAINGAAQSRIDRIRLTARFYSVIVGCAVISVAFLMAALTIVIASRIGIVYACLTMSAVFAVFALGGFLHMNATRRKEEVAKAEQMMVASSASTPVGAGLAVSALAFVRGFMNPR